MPGGRNFFLPHLMWSCYLFTSYGSSRATSRVIRVYTCIIICGRAPSGVFPVTRARVSSYVGQQNYM
ncbi:hypothetical protein PF004_g11533 [Phytophthora fragariae]|uniref:Secreted protein n=1 Tax=Phytophthora fragariae TaxID=53985 RepID=A0A6G0NXV1_9STRA|nr:hypothetical protein PF004_g11533 [Phytophthora fragariae]